MLRYEGLPLICNLCRDIFCEIHHDNLRLHKIFGICNECCKNENVSVKLNKLLKHYRAGAEKPSWWSSSKFERMAWKTVQSEKDTVYDEQSKEKIRMKF